MPDKEKRKWGRNARKWALQNFSIESVGKQIENFLDDCPILNEDDNENFSESTKLNKNPSAYINPNQQDKDWIKSLYLSILDKKIEDDDDGLLYWINELSKNVPREQIENYFRHVAQKDIDEENQKNNKSSIEDFLIKNNKKKILYVMPRSIGDCFLSTAIFESLREIYDIKEWDLYVSSEPEFKSIFNGNKNITKWIPYSQEMEDHMKMEGIGDHHGWFDICFTPHISTQRSMNYIHNGINKLLL
jgi:hypothetical protein